MPIKLPLCGVSIALSLRTLTKSHTSCLFCGTDLILKLSQSIAHGLCSLQLAFACTMPSTMMLLSEL